MISQLAIDVKKCVGCTICEMACSLYNNKECNPRKSNIRVIRYEEEGIVYSVPVVCQQCEKAICKEVCPVRAIYRDIKTGALLINDSKCIGCKSCVNACPFGGISFEKDKGISTKCSLCNGEPKCAEFCPTGALSLVRLDKIDIWKKRAGVDRYLESVKNVMYAMVMEKEDER
jgi:Fe-S-cluster-containing hydrogenase component 2